MIDLLPLASRLAPQLAILLNFRDRGTTALYALFRVYTGHPGKDDRHRNVQVTIDFLNMKE
jgi:hypothetical protein